MAKIAKVGDKTLGSFDDGHCNHIDPETGDKIHSYGTVDGEIQPNGGTVFIGGVEVATEGYIVNETDSEDSGTGTIGPCSSTVFVNGKPIAKIGDQVISHTGKPAEIIDSDSSDTVIVN